jgi:hypothetical protein
MSSSEEAFQAVAINYQVTFVTIYEFIAFELNQKFGHSRTRSSHQVSQVLMACAYRQANPAFIFDAEILG